MVKNEQIIKDWAPGLEEVWAFESGRDSIRLASRELIMDHVSYRWYDYTQKVELHYYDAPLIAFINDIKPTKWLLKHRKTPGRGWVPTLSLTSEDRTLIKKAWLRDQTTNQYLKKHGISLHF